MVQFWATYFLTGQAIIHYPNPTSKGKNDRRRDINFVRTDQIICKEL